MSRISPLTLSLVAGMGLCLGGPLRVTSVLSASGAFDADVDVDADALAQLLAGLADTDEGVKAAARQGLEALGADAIPDLLSLLSGHERPIDGGRWLAVLPEVYGEVTALLRSESTTRLVARTTSAVGADAGLPERLEAVRLLGATVDATGLTTILSILENAPGSTLRHPRVRDVVEEALAGVLERDMRGHAILGAELSKVPAGLGPAVVGALGRVRGPYGVALLDRMTTDGLVTEVLDAVAEWDPWSAEALNGACGDLARSFVVAGDPRLCRSAVAVLGKLRDSGSIDDMIDLLEDQDPRVRRSAHWSLKRISGRTWSAEVTRWVRWRAAEANWFQERASSITAELDGDMASAVGALRELAEHAPLDSSLREAVVAMLEHERAPVAVAAANTLLRLGDAGAVEGLSFAVDDRRVPVSQAANAALVKITGRVPAEATGEGWRAMLGI